MAMLIIRIYKVPGTRYEAIGRFQEALRLHVEQDFHVKDIVRDGEAKTRAGRVVDVRPPKGWLALLKEQVLGKAEEA